MRQPDMKEEVLEYDIEEATRRIMETLHRGVPFQILETRANVQMQLSVATVQLGTPEQNVTGMRPFLVFLGPGGTVREVTFEISREEIKRRMKLAE